MGKTTLRKRKRTANPSFESLKGKPNYFGSGGGGAHAFTRLVA
jgi:hypothetical protein